MLAPNGSTSFSWVDSAEFVAAVVAAAGAAEAADRSRNGYADAQTLGRAAWSVPGDS